MAQQPGDRAEVSPRLALLLGEDKVRRAHHGPGDAASHDGEHGAERQVDREHVQGAAPVEQARMTACGRHLPDLPGRQLAVIHHRAGHHPHLVAGRVNPPAEVDVVTEQRQVAVEPANLVPHIAADQHAGRAHRQHRPVAVVLALVDLARLDPAEATPGAVGGDARLAQHAPVGQVLQLRAEDRGRPAAAGHPEHLLEGVGGRLAVIVQQPYPLDRCFLLGAGSRRGTARGRVLQRAGHGRAVAGIGFHAEDRVRTQELGQRCPAAVPAARVDPDDARHGMRLLPHPVDESRQ